MAVFKKNGYDDYNRYKYTELKIYYSNGDGNNFTVGTSYALDDKPAIFMPGDFNGDGYSDILILKNSNSKYNLGVYLGGASSMTFENLGYSYDENSLPLFKIGDFNGDGTTDWLVLSTAANNSLKIYTYLGGSVSNYHSSNIYSSYSIVSCKIADFNGNGKSDIMLIRDTDGSSACRIYEYRSEAELLMFHSTGYPTKNHRLFPGDFNGDGKTDLLTWCSSSGWEMKYYGVNDFIATTGPDCPITRQNDPEEDDTDNNYIISDFNGDGKADILEHYKEKRMNSNYDWVFHHSVFNIYLSKGKTFQSEQLTSGLEDLIPYKSDYYTSNDFNGDGINDCFFETGYYANNRQILVSDPNSREKLTTSITNGYNKTTSFEYLPLTNSTIHTSGSGNDLDNDVIEIQPALMVTWRVTSPDAVGGSGTNYTDYWYHGLKLHKKGKGLLGFESVYSTNNYGQGTELHNTFETTFFTINQTRTVTNGAAYPTETTIYKSIRSYSETLGRKHYFSYPSSKFERDLDKGITIQSVYDYDDNGNLTEVNVNHNYEGSTRTVNENFVAANTWLPSAPKKSTLTKTRTGKAAYTVVSELDYYTDGSLKSKKVIPDGQAAKTLTTTFINNGLGLPTKTTVASSTESRVAEVGYDGKYRYVESSENALGFTTSSTHDPKTGNVLTETDILGLTTRHYYDAFGGLTLTRFPDNTTASVAKGWSQNSPANTAYYIEQTSSGSAPVKTYYNHLGKKMQVVSKSFDGTDVYTDYEYNPNGQIYKEYEPSLSSKGGDYTTYFYNPRLQIYNVVSPIGTTQYRYSGKETTITDPSGKATTKTVNAYGDVAEASDNGGTITYAYNSKGLPETITAPGSTISLGYDEMGNKTILSDPNTGTIDYTYDAFGNLLTQVDSKNNSYTMTYDKLDRLETKKGPEGDIEYVYDIATNGKGQIAHVKLDGIIKQSYEYDSYGRNIKSTEIIDSRPFVYSYSYDTYGREKGTTYPSGFGIVNKYNGNGYLEKIMDAGETFSIWQATEYNVLGQLKQASLGNGKTITKGYDDYHRLNAINYGGYANLGFEFYKETGNLESRTFTKGVTVLTETFEYDDLNRLDIAKINGVKYMDMQYDNATGNITFKDDVGDYQYNSAKPHAVTDLVNLTGSNPIPSADQTITYNGFNKVETIDEGDYHLAFTYGLDQQRRKTVLSNNSSVLKTKYFAGAYEEEITTSGTKKTHYISGGDGLAAVFITNGTIAQGNYYYTYTDHLGSIIALADASGNVSTTNEQSFGPWGRRRNVTNWGYSGANTIALLDRGYTGHQHLPEFGIINMNGRLYDPVLGRMLSPDNYVQMPDFSQSFNRYSYCWNNPLIYTDPSGEFLTWNIGNGGFSVGFNFTPIGIPLGAGINVGYGDGFSLGAYGEVGPRVGGTGFGSGFTVSQSIDYNFRHESWSTTTSMGAYASYGVFNAGANFSHTYDITNKQFSTGWGTSAGISFGNDERGLGLNIGYGSDGFSYGVGGYYNSKAWDSNPEYDSQTDNQFVEKYSRNCYAYMLDLMSEFFVKMQPGEFTKEVRKYVKQYGPPIFLDAVLDLAIKDGHVKKPNFFNKLGFGKRGYYSGYLAIDTAHDYHWYRQDKGGTWSHKPGFSYVTNIDASGNKIKNPARANRNYGFHRNYTDGGIHVWVKAK